MSPGQQGSAPPKPSLWRGRPWLPVAVLGAAALLYASVWKLPALFSGRAPAGVLVLSRLENGDWVELPDGVEVPGRARVRFGVRLERPASVVLIGLNAEGRATLYVPASGSPPRLKAGIFTVGEQVLDGVPGPELFLAVLCNTPLAPDVVVKAGERAAAAAGEPGRVQTLDLGCPEATLRLVKEAP
jgi:hypothetical protein